MMSVNKDVSSYVHTPNRGVLTSKFAVQDHQDQLVLLDLDDFPVVSVQPMEVPLPVPIAVVTRIIFMIGVELVGLLELEEELCFGFARDGFLFKAA